MRIPRIAGSWYPNSAEEILKLVGAEKPAGPTLDRPAALIVPHAGYAYSGGVAARAFARLPTNAYERVIILAPSHRVAMRRSFSVEPAVDVATPFGTVKFSQTLHDRLAALPGARFVAEAHPLEHAIDIELPLVRHYLPDCEVAAAVVGQWDFASAADVQVLADFAAAFRRLLDPRTLVVVSSDFTHYGRDFDYVPFTDDVKTRLPALDKMMFEKLSANDNRIWSEALHETGATICGASCLHLLLAALPASARFERLEYATSGDRTGEWTHVVGYASGAVYADWTEPLKSLTASTSASGELSAAAGRMLLEVAEHSLEAALLGKERAGVQDIPAEIRRELQRTGGAFVTLTENGQLRGCIGQIVSDRPVLDTVREMAVSAGLHDPRFMPVRANELPALRYEVSVLTEPTPVKGPGDIVIGRDGVILSKRGRRAVFLPQVAPEQRWDVPTMLMHLSLKAGLAADDWKSGAAFETFRAQVFKNP